VTTKSVYQLGLTIISILLFLPQVNAWADPAVPTTQPFTLGKHAMRVSPFTAVRWRGDVVEVRYEDTWYELRSIDVQRMRSQPRRVTPMKPEASTAPTLQQKGMHWPPPRNASMSCDHL